MDTVLGEFQGAEFAVYNFSFPGDWNELVKERVNGVESAAADLLHLDFWDGMTSVEGYSAIRFYDSIFYKTPHLGTWDAALAYDVNQIYAAFSRGFENWEYASERVHVSPFSWLNAGPDETSTFDDAQSPEYVSDQLEAFRKWGSGGEFANFVYGGLDPAQYEDYRSAMEAASSPGTVDETDPTVEIADAGPHPVITGTATDNLGIKAVRWQDDQGGSGVAELQWEVLDGDYDAGYRVGDALVGARRRAESGGVGADRDRRGHQGPHVGARRPAAGMKGPGPYQGGEPGRARPDLLRDLATRGRWPASHGPSGPLPRRPRPLGRGGDHRGLLGRARGRGLSDPRVTQGPPPARFASRRRPWLSSAPRGEWTSSTRQGSTAVACSRPRPTVSRSCSSS